MREIERNVYILGVVLLWSQLWICHSFMVCQKLSQRSSPLVQRKQQQQQQQQQQVQCNFQKRGGRQYTSCCWETTLLLASSTGYIPPEESSTMTTTDTTSKSPKKALWPQVGDIVRFYDLDGGNEQGQVLIGRISFIQKNLGKEGSGWSVELAELDDVGDGYYAEYPFQKRGFKKTIRDLAMISPIAASYVRTEAAFKIPLDKDGIPSVRAEKYDLESFPGPFAGENAINQDVVLVDAAMYGSLKSKLLRYSALAGLVGTVTTDLLKGLEDATIYFAGVVASLFYLFFLTMKTDTIASQEAKLGSNFSNLRFITPLILIVGVAMYNKSLGDENPVLGQGPFATVTAEQFAAAVLGFLTYRLPLFLTQIADAFQESNSEELLIPGSIGVAMQLAAGKSNEDVLPIDQSALPTIFLVSGPQATGRSELVNRLVGEGEGKFIKPKMFDRNHDPAIFERLASRGEFLYMDPLERYGLTKDSILSTAKECRGKSVVVLDADVEFVKKLQRLAGVRLVGVWVGLDNMTDFETTLGQQIDSGAIEIAEDVSRESAIRARIRDIVQEIEYGISCGIFEFTIINQDEEESLKQLREASAYCFQ